MTVVTTLKPRDYQSEHELTGKVIHTYYSSDSFTAGIIQVADGPPWDRDCRFSVKGKVEYQEVITLRGGWSEHAKYGMQFVAESLSYPMPDVSGVDGLAEYLEKNPAFKGIGPVKARLIAEQFGDSFDSIIRNSPELLISSKLLTAETVETLREEWTARADLNAISTWLASWGLTHCQVKKIADKYGNKAKQLLEDDPYVLCQDIQGLGFLTVDKIATDKLGIVPTHPGRIQAALRHILVEDSESAGNTYIERASLVAKAIKLLYFDTLDADACIRRNLDEMCAAGNLLVSVEVEVEGDKQVVALRHLYEKEQYLILALRDSRGGGLKWDDGTEAECAERFVRESLLNAEQQTAIWQTLNNRISVMSGGAGTGKSFTIQTLTALYKKMGKTVAICAPTGKAAQRLSRGKEGVEASTIHRLLKYEWATQSFHFGLKDKLPHHLVIVDEVSMCNVSLLYSLFSAIDFERTQLLMVGDHQQLPPIGAGNTLKDILRSSLTPITILQECQRAAGDLAVNSNAILHGSLCKSTLPSELGWREWHVIDDKEDANALIAALRHLILNYLPKWDWNDLMDWQIITPYNRGALGVTRLNLEIQRWLHPDDNLSPILPADYNRRAQLLVGDKIIQVKNDYKIGIMNGMQGVVTKVTRDSNGKLLYRITFDSDTDNPIPTILEQGSDELKNVSLAYVITCHKSQGSEWPLVVSILHRMHTFMLAQNLLYTAVTRARQSSILIGDKLGMRRALTNTSQQQRLTFIGLEGQK